MKRAQLKRKIASLLREEELDGIIKQLAAFDQRTLINPLLTYLCHTDEKIRWYSVSVIGEVVKNIAVEEIENARVVMRRFLWMLNDESGGIGWGVPEAMSESMYHNSILAGEYMHMLVSYARDDGPELYQDGNFIELPLLQQGVLWGLCRLAVNYKEQLIEKEVHENMGFYLRSEDPQVRGLASLLCGLIGRAEFVPPLNALITDSNRVRVYTDGTMSAYTVGQLASAAVASLSDNGATGIGV